jgi:transaldolase
MKAPHALHQLGQSLWLDNISRPLLRSGTLAHCIQDLSVTGLTSNPTIFEKAIGSGDSYDASIRRLTQTGLAGEDLFFELALEDLKEAVAPVLRNRLGLAIALRCYQAHCELLAFADHGRPGRPLPTAGAQAEAVIGEFRHAGVDADALAVRLQREGVDAFAASWHALLTRIREKCAATNGPA